MPGVVVVVVVVVDDVGDSMMLELNHMRYEHAREIQQRRRSSRLPLK
jgi:hypothetical protein